MSDIAETVCKTSFQNEKKLNKLFEPFFRSTGIEGFWYWTLSKTGKLTHVTTSAEMSEHFYRNELFKGHPHFRSPEHIPSSFLFPEKVCDEQYEQTQGVMNDEFSLDQLFMMVNSDGNQLCGYGFGTYKDRPDLTNLYLNNLFLFKKFIRYFHEECKEIIKLSDHHAVDIAAEIGEDFYSPPTLYSEVHIDEEMNIFHNSRYQIELESLNKLSQREKECAKWFLKGGSAAQISKAMHLSPRTVEFYLNNMKNKLNCHSKQELFMCLQEWKEYLNLTFF